ncbi:hypothetical protein JGH11_06385 [Dysgonomonas sp. Marseille-P4677]|uniref:hypothetical protein n=1 Tax=Dysgonomonas sp. Marseille-P4677 TaxID=2364790 RepID=UPI001913BE37|nr:hypothetical protein [Dysgonomonas sp. Marseille-P4677]MBK5720494.1 hypothetical protein [Dysgonomonas sp. Marseille-P4677]
MKAIVLTSVLTILLSVSGLYANEPQNTILCNQETSEFGLKKECISLDKATSNPVGRTIYTYNTAGELQEKVCYVWDRSIGWTGLQKYEYEYNEKGQVTNLIHTAWNPTLASWSSKSQHILHIYNADGSLLAVKKVQVDNAKDGLVAIK